MHFLHSASLHFIAKVEFKNHRLSKKAHHRAMIAVFDFNEVRYYLESIAAETPDRLKIAAILAAIISYCRPFQKSNEGKNKNSHQKINLKPENVLTKEEYEFHKKIIVLRNSVIAHSDFDYKKSIILSESNSSYSFSVHETHLYLVQINESVLHKISDKFGMATQMEAFNLYEKIKKEEGNE